MALGVSSFHRNGVVSKKDCAYLTEVVSKPSNIELYFGLREGLAKAENFECIAPQLEHIAQKLPHYLLSKKIHLLTTDPSGKVIASLQLDFFNNRLITYFEGEEKSVTLSFALGIIYDLSEIFTRIETSPEESFYTKKMIMETLNNCSSYLQGPNKEFAINGEKLIEFCPQSQRVVFSTSRGYSSILMKLIGSCSHLFNRTFAETLGSTFDAKTDERQLWQIIQDLYFGRYIVGLAKRDPPLDHKGMEETKRILSLMINGNFGPHISPIL